MYVYAMSNITRPCDCDFKTIFYSKWKSISSRM